jgi:hypothetical protein
VADANSAEATRRDFFVSEGGAGRLCERLLFGIDLRLSRPGRLGLGMGGDSDPHQ